MGEDKGEGDLFPLILSFSHAGEKVPLNAKASFFHPLLSQIPPWRDREGCGEGLCKPLLTGRGAGRAYVSPS